MLRFCVSRLSLVLLMAVLATLVIFLIANTVPGDPIMAQLGDLAASDPAFVAKWRHTYGLDLPLWQRYFVFLRGLLHGDLGLSIASHPGTRHDILHPVAAGGHSAWHSGGGEAR
jgi:peptide/nickel transport system permease protein